FVREIPVDFSSTEQRDVLATLWARNRVDDLMSQDFNGAQRGTMKDDVKQAITQLGLDYRLMTQFTSFVAVEEMIVTDGGQPRRVDVPVEIPEGMNRDAIFGERQIASAPINGRGYANFAITQNVVVTSRSVADTPVPRTRKAAGGVSGGTGSAAPAPKTVSIDMVLHGKDTEELRAMTPEGKKRADLQSKFHPTVL